MQKKEIRVALIKIMNFPGKCSARLHVMVFLLLTGFSLFGQQLPYLDPKQPIEQRVEDLLSRMTLEENRKIL